MTKWILIGLGVFTILGIMWYRKQGGTNVVAPPSGAPPALAGTVNRNIVTNGPLTETRTGRGAF
jgi:hypothetical protein